MSTNSQPATGSGTGSALGEKELLGTGMAFTLIFLIVQLFVPERRWPIICAMAVLLVTMTVPSLLRPAARAWFGLSHALGAVMSKVLLSVIYVGVVVPIGLAVQRLRGDALKLKAFKRDEGSLFVDRTHTYTAKDLDHPY